jgi:patatin-related protein
MENPSAASANPKVELDKEVRFAVVMYGGISLAIYINGVAQELLHMARATAELNPAQGSDDRLPINGNDFKFTDTERVYRKVSYLLCDESLQAKDEQECLRELENKVKANETINLQFKVDILSGTSAGGINSIYLAKALANDQNISPLKDLWVTEGDIAALLNDYRSVEQPFTLKEPPASLLNSQRIYDKLLKAFDGMDDNGKRQTSKGVFQSPYVDELDLFITATDIQGVPLPLRLADKLVYERRHRNVFHFRYAKTEVNDFIFDNNPFLAYAARCTSSFPLAFEPMALGDIDEVVGASPNYVGKENCRSKNKSWEKFFIDYVNPKVPNLVAFQDRAFGDGGYLDNKPFSYATETLQHRLADVPVDRKLIYIEPSPEHPESERQKKERPNPLENAQAALLTIPRYETIREDLQRVLERNRLIQRVNRIINDVESDIDAVRTLSGVKPSIPEYRLKTLGQKHDLTSISAKPLTDEEWAKLDLSEMADRKGPGYAAYHRLEISSVTAELARLITLNTGFDAQSDYLLAIHSLVRAWRDLNYTDYRKAEEKDLPDEKKTPTLNKFLQDFDITYSLRRIKFVKSKIDQLCALDDDALNERAAKILNLRGYFSSDIKVENREAVKRELKAIKKKMNEEYKKIRGEYQQLWSRPGSISSTNGNPASKGNKSLLQSISSLNINTKILEEILGRAEQGIEDNPSTNGRGEPIEDACKRRATKFLIDHDDLAKSLTKIGRELGSHIGDLNRNTDKKILDALKAPSQSNEIHIARAYAGYYYQFYDDYDMMIFPILYSTDVGEADLVEVFRVSPEDAVALIDEKKHRCKKLAGEALGHFGAFFDELWRENDILWGRLDGAERIITALLPGNSKVARALIGEAQAAIVCEEIARRGENETNRLLAESFMRTDSGKPEKNAITAFVKNLKEYVELPDALPKLKDGLRKIDGEKLRDFYEDIFERSHQLQPKPTLITAARATAVFGKILQGISTDYDNRGSRAALWVTRLGQIFWGLVEVAIPNSIPNIVFLHWLKLIYLFEALMIVGGIFFSTTIRDFGWKALGITLIVNATVLLLTDIMRYRLERWRITKVALVVAIIFLVGLGFLALPQLASSARDAILSSAENGTLRKLLVQANGALAFLALGFSAYLSIQSGVRARQNEEAETKSQAQKAIEADSPEKKTAQSLGKWLRVKTREDVKSLVGQRGDIRRHDMRESLMADNVYIIIYWLLFIGMSLLLYKSVLNAAPVINGIILGKNFALALAVASGILGTATAVFDGLENKRILRLLEIRLEKIDPKMLSGIRRASIFKFILTFITIGMLSGIFLFHRGWVSIIGWVLLLSGLVGLLGIIAAFAAPSFKLIEAAFLLFGIGLIVIAVWFMIWPEGFLARIYRSEAMANTALSMTVPIDFRND